MQINETTLNCCKPKRFTTFKGKESSKTGERRVQSKHYREMSDDVLRFKSILKAHNDVQNGAKMRMFKALPYITTALIGTSIALTQPGKFATKAATGLGFLALTDIVPTVVEKIANKTNEKSENNKNTSALKTVAKFAFGAAVIGLAAFGLKNTKAYNNVSKFLKREANQLSNEVNNTKIAKAFNEKLAPKIDKHASKFAVASLGILTASSLAQLKLADGLSEDIKNKAEQYYQKGKFIQAQARAHYDSIDAPEIK